jgi:hypothetical protein
MKNAPEVVETAAEAVVDTFTASPTLFTPKRLLIAAGVVVAVSATVFVVKKVRASKDVEVAEAE